MTPTEHRQGAGQQASNVASEAGVRSNAGLLRDKNVSPDAWVKADSESKNIGTAATTFACSRDLRCYEACFGSTQHTVRPSAFRP